MDRICIDGFPRSGNTFSQQILTNAFPQAWVTPFTHNAQALTKEHFVTIRNPNVSISSFMSVFREPNANASERWWLRFHNIVLNKIDPKRWIFFDDLINKTDETINHIGNVTSLKPIKIDYSTLSKNSALEPYSLYSFNEAEKLYLKLKEGANK
jgi:hypothetical protein